MSIVDQNETAQYLRLKQRQNQLERELAQIKQVIKPIEEKLSHYLSSNNKILQINQRIKLRTEQSAPYEPLSFKYIESSLEKAIPNRTQREKLLQFLKDNRSRVLKTKVVIDLL